MEENKTVNYKKNSNLEFLLSELNSLTKRDYEQENTLNYPTLFIVGTPRSGTTLLTQWLASLNLFCYPSNFVSRFYSNPYIGFLIQEMLYNEEYSYKSELQVISSSTSFKSDVGKTSGPLEPHEFWYFWREHFQFPEIPIEEDEFLKNANFASFKQHIAKVQNYFKKPFFLKSLIMNWYIESFYKNIPNAIFLYIKRDSLDNMQSLLDVRKRYLGDEELWFSFKPKEFTKISDKNKYIQVAGQVEFTNKEIEKQLSNIPFENKLEINYKDFCENPQSTYFELKTKMRNFGTNLPDICPVQNNFLNTVSIRSYDEKLVKGYDYIINL